MSPQPHAAQMTVPGMFRNLPVDAPAAGSHDVSFLNGRPQVDLPIGVLETGQELFLRITDLHYLDQLVYRAMLAQSRLANATPRTERAA
jgi:hypothetical protein